MAIKSPIQQQTAGRTLAIRAVIGVLVVVSAYLVFEFGRIKAGYDTVEAGNASQAYEDHIMRLENKIIDLKQKVAILETNREIDRESYKVVEESLLTLKVKIQEQRETIAFYRGIVSPSDGK